MLHLEKKIARTSLNILNDKYHFSLIYQLYPTSTHQKEEMKIQIIQTSPDSEWKLTTKFQEVQSKGTVFYVFNNSWNNLEKIYNKLKLNNNVNCIGAKFHGTCISTKEIEIISNTKSTFILEKLMETQFSIGYQSSYPLINFLNLLSIINSKTM